MWTNSTKSYISSERPMKKHSHASALPGPKNMSATFHSCQNAPSCPSSPTPTQMLSTSSTTCSPSILPRVSPSRQLSSTHTYTSGTTLPTSLAAQQPSTSTSKSWRMSANSENLFLMRLRGSEHKSASSQASNSTAKTWPNKLVRSRCHKQAANGRLKIQDRKRRMVWGKWAALSRSCNMDLTLCMDRFLSCPYRRKMILSELG
jgi:hypothetical protein